MRGSCVGVVAIPLIITSEGISLHSFPACLQRILLTSKLPPFLSPKHSFLKTKIPLLFHAFSNIPVYFPVANMVDLRHVCCTHLAVNLCFITHGLHIFFLLYWVFQTLKLSCRYCISHKCVCVFISLLPCDLWILCILGIV